MLGAAKENRGNEHILDGGERSTAQREKENFFVLVKFELIVFRPSYTGSKYFQVRI